jgi:hypothetical protein
MPKCILLGNPKFQITILKTERVMIRTVTISLPLGRFLPLEVGYSILRSHQECEQNWHRLHSQNTDNLIFERVRRKAAESRSVSRTYLVSLYGLGKRFVGRMSFYVQRDRLTRPSRSSKPTNEWLSSFEVGKRPPLSLHNKYKTILTKANIWLE